MRRCRCTSGVVPAAIWHDIQGLVVQRTVSGASLPPPRRSPSRLSPPFEHSSMLLWLAARLQIVHDLVHLLVRRRRGAVHTLRDNRYPAAGKACHPAPELSAPIWSRMVRDRPCETDDTRVGNVCLIRPVRRRRRALGSRAADVCGGARFRASRAISSSPSCATTIISRQSSMTPR